MSYLVWPTKRRWSNRNFGYVLGLPPSHPRVRRMALRAYLEYGRYLVELMRLPTRSPEQMAAMVPVLDTDDLARLADASRGGVIYTVGHVGSNDAVMAAIARYGMPISVLADDSSFPELFDRLQREREAWGARVIAWRNLREIYRVLRRREMLALLIDWGYRADGIPVRLFGAWTALPAGPATLAAKTGSRDPAGHRPTPAGRHLQGLVGEPHRGDLRPTPPSSSARPRRSPTRSSHHRVGAGAVVQLQADLAGDAPRRPPTSSAGRRPCRPAARTPGRGPATPRRTERP